MWTLLLDSLVVSEQRDWAKAATILELRPFPLRPISNPSPVPEEKSSVIFRLPGGKAGVTLRLVTKVHCGSCRSTLLSRDQYGKVVMPTFEREPKYQ